MTQDEINEEKAWALLSAQLSGEANKRQQQALQKWVNEYPCFEPVLKNLTALWKTSNSSAIRSIDAQLAFERHWKKIEQLEERAGIISQDHQQSET